MIGAVSKIFFECKREISGPKAEKEYLLLKEQFMQSRRLLSLEYLETIRIPRSLQKGKRSSYNGRNVGSLLGTGATVSSFQQLFGLRCQAGRSFQSLLHVAKPTIQLLKSCLERSGGDALLCSIQEATLQSQPHSDGESGNSPELLVDFQDRCVQKVLGPSKMNRYRLREVGAQKPFQSSELSTTSITELSSEYESGVSRRVFGVQEEY